MIKINALYFLLLIELLIIFAGLAAFLVVREKKRIMICREIKKSLDSEHTAKEELQKQVAALKAGGTQQSMNQEGAAAAKTPPAPNVNAKDYDACKMKVAILEEKLKEKTKLLIELQAKFDSVEKEYLLLYQQHQAQEQHMD